MGASTSSASLAVVVLVLGGSQLVTTPTASAQRADPVALDASAPSVPLRQAARPDRHRGRAQPDAQVDFYAKAVGWRGQAARLRDDRWRRQGEG